MNLLEFKKTVYSQWGEDGIIEEIFNRIGTKSKICCEFGAWDGIHLSNTANLIKNKGWFGVFIEEDSERYNELCGKYPQSNMSVMLVNQRIDSQKPLLARWTSNLHGDVDFLSVDIDGLDYEVLENLDISPRVICIEVGAGWNPETIDKPASRDQAMRNLGQPLGYFNKIAAEKGYKLVCYTGNAFFVKEEETIESLTPLQAYLNYLATLTLDQREWLRAANCGQVDPWYYFDNPHLR